MNSTTSSSASVRLFAITSFLSAFLLFSVQPMFAKMILPKLGGTPAVWNTCVVFFQAALLAGYGLAHLLLARLGARRQAILHALILLLPLLILPIRIPSDWAPPTTANPIPSMLVLMLLRVGLPFLVVAMSAPLLQTWFAHTDHPLAHDPYFLYAASNGGSLIALLSYPFLIEPLLRLTRQSQVWTVGYCLLMIFMCLCAWTLWRARTTSYFKTPRSLGFEISSSTTPNDHTLTWRRRVRWIALSFVPSSLLLGVTTYLSTDIAAIPLLWVIPLAVYLLTFVLVFARTPLVPHQVIIWLLPFVVLPLIVPLILQTGNVWVMLSAHILMLFVAAMLCHGELAKDRPPAQHLTEFYWWLSVGGMLGGVFNALIAPLIFPTAIEYPLAIVLVCLLRPSPNHLEPSRIARRWLDYVLPLALGLLMVGVIIALRLAKIESRSFHVLLLYVPGGLLCYSFRDRPLRFGLGIAALFLVGLCLRDWKDVLYVKRSFFGIYRVTTDSQGPSHTLHHGTTVHGIQNVDPKHERTPLTYYHPTGPLGQIFDAFASPVPVLDRVAAIGLGTGSVACYASPGQEWTFYEIDPLVKRIATNPRLFTFTNVCLERLRVVFGDARLSLARAPQASYRLIIVDAFSSDAIPLHLITQEAIHLYFAKLADGGLLALHISNRYLTLEPVLSALADAEGLVGIAEDEEKITDAEKREGKRPSHWVVLARSRTDLRQLTADARWHSLSSQRHFRTWTDEFSNIVSVFK